MYEIKVHDGITKWETILTTNNYNEVNNLYEKLLKVTTQGGVSLSQNGKQIKAVFIPKLKR